MPRRGRLAIALFLGIVSLASVDSLHAADMTVQEFRERVQRGDRFLLIDVREPWEYEEFNLGGELIPMGQLGAPETVSALRSKLETYGTDELVVYDRAGARSGVIQMLLISQGFANVRNLTGGVVAWIEAFGRERPQLPPGAPATPVPPTSTTAPPDPPVAEGPEEAGAEPGADTAVDEAAADETAEDPAVDEEQGEDDWTADDAAEDPGVDEEQGEDDGTADDDAEDDPPSRATLH